MASAQENARFSIAVDDFGGVWPIIREVQCTPETASLRHDPGQAGFNSRAAFLLLLAPACCHPVKGLLSVSTASDLRPWHSTEDQALLGRFYAPDTVSPSYPSVWKHRAAMHFQACAGPYHCNAQYRVVQFLCKRHGGLVSPDLVSPRTFLMSHVGQSAEMIAAVLAGCSGETTTEATLLAK